jgi:hypothetical protein
MRTISMVRRRFVPTQGSLAAGRRRIAPPLLLALVLGACGGSEQAGGPPASPPEETTVSVVMTDYSVNADPASSPAGAVTFDVEVEAGIHALTVLRTDLAPDQLPTRNDAAYVDTTDERIEVIVTEAASKDLRSLEAELAPGPYVLVCNLDGHYTAGMRTDFKVA